MTYPNQLVRTPLPSSVRVETGIGGLARLAVERGGTTAQVYFQGAHVTAWHPAGADTPVLWMSARSQFEPGRPIRGGVPICFPWFGAHDSDPAAPGHGFARLRDWTLADVSEDGAAEVTLVFELAGGALAPAWPHEFLIRHRVTVGPALRMELEVENTGKNTFTFEEALHTYFAVSDIGQVTVTGLEGSEYLDKVAGSARHVQADEPVRFTGETDRIYLATRAACLIHDPGRARRIAIRKTGSDATVVWNPWIDKSRAMPDFSDDEWPEMLCVETCNVKAHARTLTPGASHTMTALVEVLGPSS